MRRRAPAVSGNREHPLGTGLARATRRQVCLIGDTILSTGLMGTYPSRESQTAFPCIYTRCFLEVPARTYLQVPIGSQLPARLVPNHVIISSLLWDLGSTQARMRLRIAAVVIGLSPTSARPSSH